MFWHTRAGAWVKVRLCLFLQVGLLKCTFPSGSLIALVGLNSEMGVGLFNGHLLVGLLSGGAEYRRMPVSVRQFFQFSIFNRK